MNSLQIDFFELTDENDKGRSRIKAVIGEDAKAFLKKMILDIRNINGFTMNRICKDIGISFGLYGMHFKRSLFYLDSIKELILLWSNAMNKTESETQSKIEHIQKMIDRLHCGCGNNSVNVKIPRNITHKLCLIAGSLVADGNLYKGDKKWSIVIADQDKDNIDLFSKWCFDSFDFKPKVKKKKKERCWFVEFSNKIIFRYLNNVLEIQKGNKSSTVFMPNKIRKLELSYRISFVKGVLMFDGGSKFYKCNFDFSTMSRRLFEDVLNTLKEIDIKADFISNHRNPANNLFQFSIWNKETLQRFINLFLENGTTKWKQIEYQLNTRPHAIEEIINLYPPPRNNIMTYGKVFKVMNKYDMITKRQLAILLERSERNVGAVLSNLNKWNIIDYQNSRNGKLWKITDKEVQHA